MAGQRTTFAKLQRERNKKARAAAKRAQRQGNDPVPVTDTAPPPVRGPRDVLSGSGRLSPDQLLEAVQKLTDQKAAGVIDEDEFEEKRQALLERVG